MLEVLVILSAIIGLWAVISSKQDEFLGFGELQEYIIDASNNKDAELLYLDTATELALANTTQKILGEQGGFNSLDTVTGNNNDLGCGTHIYAMYTDDSGNNCFDNVDPKNEYLDLFKDNLYKYLYNNPSLSSKDYEITLRNNKIIGIANYPTEIPIIIDDSISEISVVPQANINNKKSNVKGGKEVAKTAITIDPATISSDGCAGYLTELLLKVFTKNNNLPQQIPSCITGDAWDIAACHLIADQSISNPNLARVVYTGPGLTYEQLVAEDLLEKGDLLFLSTKTTWCKWSGFNAYNFNQGFENPEELENALSYCNGESGRSALRENPIDGFCAMDTFDVEANPGYCNFDENGMTYENFPVVTHILLYVGDGKVAHKWDSKYVNQDLSSFMRQNSHKFDGIRIIVRPDYMEKE